MTLKIIKFLKLNTDMELLAYPEAYINNTGNNNISNSNQAILPPELLKKYEKEILDNPDGCIFKITYFNPTFECTSVSYVSCLEFSAPENSCFLPNSKFESLLMDFNQPSLISIEIFNPPQATFIKFEVMDTLLDMIPDLKTGLEELLTKQHKFISKNQVIPLLDHSIKVIQLEPFDICLINNTEAEVEFDILKKVPLPKVEPIIRPDILNGPFSISTRTIPLEDDEVQINDTGEVQINDDDSTSSSEKLTREEIRQKRIAFFANK